MSSANPFAGRVCFAVGSGRCGTQFLSRVMAQESTVASVHERFPLVESFHRYCKWYQLPVDDEGFLAQMQAAIQQDLRERKLSFEASAYLSFSVGELARRFAAKFVLLVRQPDRVVNSLLRKGWYQEPVTWRQHQLAPGYQQTPRFHHFLCRIMPTGAEQQSWQSLTRVGKLAWYWTALNRAALGQLGDLAKQDYQVIRLEDLNYRRYQQLAAFAGLTTEHTAESFDAIAQQRPNHRPAEHFVASWSPRERQEFERAVTELAQQLGYEYRTDRLEKESIDTRGSAAGAPGAGTRKSTWFGFFPRRRQVA